MTYEGWYAIRQKNWNQAISVFSYLSESNPINLFIPIWIYLYLAIVFIW